MRHFLKIILFIALNNLNAAMAAMPLEVGKKQLDLGLLPTGRPAHISLWYPKGACENAHELCLHEGAQLDKTLLISHGAMGSADNYSWLGELFAGAGFIVVGLNHFGESWAYGPFTQNGRYAGLMWYRAEDASAVYDALSRQALFQKPVNWSNIIALGHSSGGQTVASLAGVRYNLSQIQAFCSNPAAENDHSCDYGQRQGGTPNALFSHFFNGDYRDSRVKKIIMLDPTLGYGAVASTLAAVTIPTLIMGAQQNDFLPWKNHGAIYAGQMPSALVFTLKEAEGHFVFLDTCGLAIKVMGVPLCEDRAGVDRQAVHARLAPVLLQFVSQADIPLDAPKRVAEGLTMGKYTQWLSPVFLYTPTWVWGLLAGLMLVGLVQVRSRDVSVRVVFIAPVSLMIMSVLGLIMDLNAGVYTLLAWGAGVAFSYVVRVRLLKTPLPVYSAVGKRFALQGSWVPLLMIMAIFGVRFFIRSAQAFGLPMVQLGYFNPLMAGLLGVLSGYFVTQLVFYGRAITLKP